MTWQIAIAISTIANVTTILIERRYAQKSQAPATFPSAVSYICGVIPIGLFAGLLIFPHEISWSWWVIFLAATLGCSMALANWLAFIVAGKLNVAALLVIRRIASVMVILLGWTILGETLTMPQFVGGGILLVAAVMAIFAPVKNTAGLYKKLPRKYVLLAVLGALFLAIGLVTEKALLGHMQVGGIFLVSWLAQGTAMLLLATKDANKQTLRAFRSYEFKWSTLMGVANGIAGVFYVYAIFNSDNISLITAVGTIGLPLTVLGAYIFLKEREHSLLMWASLTVSFVGLLVMAL